MARRRTQRGPGRPASPPESAGVPRELIVIARPGTGLSATLAGLRSATRADVRGLAEILGDTAITLRPLFGPSEDRVRDRTAALGDGQELPDLATFYHVDAP